MTAQEFKLFEFNVYNDKGSDQSSSDDDDVVEFAKKQDKSRFMIQMFGINEQGKTCSVIVEDYQPFFYVKVDSFWSQDTKKSFMEHLKSKIGKYYEDSIVECKLIEKKKLYGFDAGKMHRFVLIKFANVTAYNKVKNLWYVDSMDEEGGRERRLLKNGYKFNGTSIELYEANIPPLLRFFHIQEISPSGWVSIPKSKSIEVTGSGKKTTCEYEFIIHYKHIEPLNNKETRVPYKIMSFDIEASSSHGDFPVPIKSYKKLATNIVDCFKKLGVNLNRETCPPLLEKMVYTAFGYDAMEHIELVYPKYMPSKNEISEMMQQLLRQKVRYNKNNEEYLLHSLFENAITANEFNKQQKATEGDCDDADDDYEDDAPPVQCEETSSYKRTAPVVLYKNSKDATIIDILCDDKFEREGKINELIIVLRNCFPPLEGDKVTFIGSTFLRYGEKEPYLNHCIALNSCDSIHDQVPNSQIESYNSEKDVLLSWTKLIQRENPDIIIGYNIFSFDYELQCVEDFLKLSRNKDELCATVDYKTGAIEIDKSSITLASGTYDLSIIKINGRLQVDMLNWFRRTENLTSYKLDYVAGHFIGDDVKSLQQLSNDSGKDVTRVKTTNLTGLLVDSYIHFEEINHSSDYYKDGAKFKVTRVNKEEAWFEILGHENPTAKKVKWGLAKDDVTPKDIFRMTNEGPSARAVIAKYCIQDCNLVHYLFTKVDVVTDLVEMAKLCSVPMSFLIFRGQGIKLTSYVAKKCREKGVLMPVIDKGASSDGYEGAIVLDPKCGLYLDNPISVGDFASLYPSSMLSENLCPSSKVWVKEYDSAGNLLYERGEKNAKGDFLYDNLENYEYVDVQFDTYKYIRKNPSARAEKVRVGFKKCRFAQYKEGKAIMPSILEELLKARKDTRKLIPQQNDEFMKNVLDKRQLAYKVTANSLYGQLGAKTSTFYEPDIAASTTATGRLLLTYAKKVVEECYGDTIVETKYGKVRTRAEYVYGDTDSVFFTFNLQDEITGEPILGERALELSIEVAQEACHNVSKFLKQPHDFEYEKTFLPFCLLSKKRYVGILYETDPKKGKRKEMGIVLKRRDNAPIVKDVYGGVIDILMKDRDVKKAMDYVNKCLQDLVEGKVPMEKLIITKSLNSHYKNPQQIAHKVLADRIARRDPGNKPTSGDRIPFVYIVNNTKSALQGDKIETPSYIIENNVQIDYSFYITNQIMKPLLQLFSLVLENIWKMQNKTMKIEKFKREMESVKKTIEDPKKVEDKIEKLRNKEVQVLIFDKYLRETNNSKEKNQSMTKFFKAV
jgi:DNA polymerase elongation subunit (family B)